MIEDDIKTPEDVRRVLGRNCSFEELLRCSAIAKEDGDLTLRTMVANRALDVALASRYPPPRREENLTSAANMIAGVSLAEAESLKDLSKTIETARNTLAEKTQKSTYKELPKGMQKVDDLLNKMLLLIDDSTPISLVKLGALLRKEPANMPGLAIEAADLALQQESYNSAAEGVRGAALADLRKYEQAILLLQAALVKTPDNKFLLIPLSRAHQGAGNAAQSLTHARHAVKVAPADEYAIRRFIGALRNSGKIDELQQALDDLEKFASESPEEHDHWTKYLAIDILIDDSDFDTARQLIDLLPEAVFSYQTKKIASIKKKLEKAAKAASAPVLRPFPEA